MRCDDMWAFVRHIGLDKLKTKLQELEVRLPSYPELVCEIGGGEASLTWSAEKRSAAGGLPANR